LVFICVHRRPIYCVALGFKDAKSPLFDSAHSDPVASFAIPAEPAVKVETPYSK
jgi:hypothetical protein